MATTRRRIDSGPRLLPGSRKPAMPHTRSLPVLTADDPPFHQLTWRVLNRTPSSPSSEISGYYQRRRRSVGRVRPRRPSCCASRWLGISSTGFICASRPAIDGARAPVDARTGPTPGDSSGSRVASGIRRSRRREQRYPARHLTLWMRHWKSRHPSAIQSSGRRRDSHVPVPRSLPGSGLPPGSFAGSISYGPSRSLP